MRNQNRPGSTTLKFQVVSASSSSSWFSGIVGSIRKQHHLKYLDLLSRHLEKTLKMMFFFKWQIARIIWKTKKSWLWLCFFFKFAVVFASATSKSLSKLVITADFCIKISVEKGPEKSCDCFDVCETYGDCYEIHWFSMVFWNNIFHLNERNDNPSSMSSYDVQTKNVQYELALTISPSTPQHLPDNQKVPPQMSHDVRTALLNSFNGSVKSFRRLKEYIRMSWKNIGFGICGFLAPRNRLMLLDLSSIWESLQQDIRLYIYIDMTMCKYMMCTNARSDQYWSKYIDPANKIQWYRGHTNNDLVVYFPWRYIELCPHVCLVLQMRVSLSKFQFL